MNSSKAYYYENTLVDFEVTQNRFFTYDHVSNFFKTLSDRCLCGAVGKLTFVKNPSEYGKGFTYSVYCKNCYCRSDDSLTVAIALDNYRLRTKEKYFAQPPSSSYVAVDGPYASKVPQTENLPEKLSLFMKKILSRFTTPSSWSRKELFTAGITLGCIVGFWFAVLFNILGS
jgi:hypothetical protein